MTCNQFDLYSETILSGHFGRFSNFWYSYEKLKRIIILRRSFTSQPWRRTAWGGCKREHRCRWVVLAFCCEGFCVCFKNKYFNRLFIDLFLLLQLSPSCWKIPIRKSVRALRVPSPYFTATDITNSCCCYCYWIVRFHFPAIFLPPACG